MTSLEENQLFERDFGAALVKKNANMLQFTKKWN